VSEIKLHLGCGKRHIPGYIHIDRTKFDHIDHVQCIEHLPQFDDDSVDLIYVCHALAYIKKPLRALKEWKRVLKPGGILRIATPDFVALCAVYTVTRDLSLITGPIFGHWNDEIQHQTVYDTDSLVALMRTAGFNTIELWRWRDIEHSNIDDYSKAYIPHMDKENGTLISLNLQCTK